MKTLIFALLLVASTVSAASKKEPTPVNEDIPMSEILVDPVTEAAVDRDTKDKGDHNNDGHLDNGQGRKQTETVVEQEEVELPKDAQKIIDDCVRRLRQCQTDHTKKGDLDAAVAVREVIIYVDKPIYIDRIVEKTVYVDREVEKTPARAVSPYRCFFVHGFTPVKELGTPTIVWSNGTETPLILVGNQDNLRGGTQIIWMSAAFAASEHRWGDTIDLAPGVPQSTLVKDRP